LPRRPFLSTPEIRRYIAGKNIRSAPVAIGRAFHKDRPDHAAQIGACLIAWPEVEMQMAALLAVLMKADTDAAMAVFLSLRRATARYDAISEAAKATLDAQGVEYVTAAMKVVQSVESERNALAHAQWGSCPLKMMA